MEIKLQFFAPKMALRFLFSKDTCMNLQLRQEKKVFSGFLDESLVDFLRPNPGPRPRYMPKQKVMNRHPDDNSVVAVDDVLEGADWERSRSGGHPGREVAGVIGEDEVGGDGADVEEDPGRRTPHCHVVAELHYHGDREGDAVREPKVFRVMLGVKPEWQFNRPQ